MKQKLAQVTSALIVAIALVAVGAQLGAAAPGDGFNCNGCIDRTDIANAAVGSGEIVKGSVTPGKLHAASKIFVRASHDSSTDYESGGAPETTTNTVTLTAPTSGYLHLQGNISVDSNVVGEASFLLRIRVDGTESARGCGSTTSANPADVTGIVAGAVVPVAAGAHTITMTIDGGCDSSPDQFGYNDNDLVVTFIPGPLGRVVNE